MSIENLKKPSKKRNFLKIFRLCCVCSTTDIDFHSDKEDTTSVKEDYKHEIEVLHLSQPTEVPNFSLGKLDRHKLARWKAESRVAEWRAASIAYRDGKIKNLTEILSEKPNKVELLRLRENAQHSIKFKQGSAEKIDFFESMELPELAKNGKSLIWTILVKPSKIIST